ncbi:hypothetical protein [Alistipes finegoldii]|nr:hypothetical protein [Alistipes finegoldii]
MRITRECDHTRNWISGDGETQTDTDLPTVIGHYCNMPLMLEWKSKSKPWGVGEMGMCYAGTPAHVSVVNGDRAFESQEGRMEGLAGEAFETISMQRGLDACYASISNLAWYGVQPLEIGLDDITRPVEAEDGIWFGPYREGVPGVQPERLGPYTTTFNPGYDPRLPLYRPWALFEGVKAAFSDTYAALPNKWAVRKHTGISEPVPAARDVVWISADPESKAERQFEELSVAFRPLDTRRNQLILLDGIRPAEDPALVERLRAALGAGSTLLVWNISPAALPLVEKLGSHAVTLTPRNAASYIIRGRHSLLNGQDLSTLYFNERTKEPVSSFVMTSGDAYATLLDPCNTDWSKWNYQEENIKTGQVLRSERESKPLGSVLLRSEAGRGELLLSAIDPFVLGNKGSALIHEMLHNLGARFNGRPCHIPAALDRNGTVVHALLSGTYAGGSMDEVMARDYLAGRYWGAMDSNEEGFWNFETMNLKGEQKDCAVYLSFWLFSPRSLVNLLLEPNMPRLDLEFAADDKTGRIRQRQPSRQRGQTAGQPRPAAAHRRHSARKGLEPCSAQGRPVMGRLERPLPLHRHRSRLHAAARIGHHAVKPRKPCESNSSTRRSACSSRPPAFKSQRPGTKGLKNAELDLSAHYKEIVQTRTERAVLPDAESVPFLTVDAAAATGR